MVTYPQAAAEQGKPPAMVVVEHTGLSIKSAPKEKNILHLIADTISSVKRLRQKQVDLVLLGPVMWTAKMLGQMLGNFLPAKELRDDLHVV